MTPSADPLVPSISFFTVLALPPIGSAMCTAVQLSGVCHSVGKLQVTVAAGSDVGGHAQTRATSCPQQTRCLVFGLVLGGSRARSAVTYLQLLVILSGHLIARGGRAGRSSRSGSQQTGCTGEERNFHVPTPRSRLASKSAHMAQETCGSGPFLFSLTTLSRAALLP